MSATCRTHRPLSAACALLGVLLVPGVAQAQDAGTTDGGAWWNGGAPNGGAEYGERPGTANGGSPQPGTPHGGARDAGQGDGGAWWNGGTQDGGEPAVAPRGRGEQGDGGGSGGSTGAPPVGTQATRPERATLVEPPEPPESRWRQVMASPRIGTRMTAVAVDPQNPNRIFVGTEAYTMLRSVDGGITWEEYSLSPFVTNRRITRPRQPGLPSLGQRPPPGHLFWIIPPYRALPAQLRQNRVLPPRVFTPDYGWFGTRFSMRRILVQENLLFDTIRSHGTFPVRRIALCPGATFPLLVAAQREVLGSMDDGENWVRLLRIPGNLQIYQINCDPDDPDDILVATQFGMFRSQDGGVTFDQDLSSRPGRAATAVGFGNDPNGPDQKQVLIASGSRLYSGDPEFSLDMDLVYPDFDNASTAPWETILWIEVLRDQYWLGTVDGLRSSTDGGQSWNKTAANLFSRQEISQVVAGASDTGGQRIAVIAHECTGPESRERARLPHEQERCRNSRVYATDDAGRTWYPFFLGETRRSVQQMAAAPPTGPGAPPRWWLVTGGELWTTVEPHQRVGSHFDRASAQWARRKLQNSPSLRQTKDAVLGQLELNADDIDALGDAGRQMELLPTINFESMLTVHEGVEAEEAGPAPFFADENRTRVDFVAAIWASWNFDFAVYSRNELAPIKNDVYELRRQIAFLVEDAWHERRLHLQRLARGMSDPYQIESLKTRITVLEVMLETWLRRPLEDVAAEASP